MLRIPKVHRTPALGFRALLTEGGGTEPMVATKPWAGKRCRSSLVPLHLRKCEEPDLQNATGRSYEPPSALRHPAPSQPSRTERVAESCASRSAFSGAA